MLKTIALTVAIAAAAALAPAGAGALPLAQDKAAIAADDTIVLVREGCGRGMQWSERRRRCVPDSPRAQIRDIVRDATDRPRPPLERSAAALRPQLTGAASSSRDTPPCLPHGGVFRAPHASAEAKGHARLAIDIRASVCERC